MYTWRGPRDPRPRAPTLPGQHHGIRIDFPDHLVEALDPEGLPGWETRESSPARDFGDTRLDEQRSVVPAVPSPPARPIGRTLLINPRHSDAAVIQVSAAFPIPWDDRLF